MSIDMPQLNYGTVVGRYLVELSDSDDSDLKPDVYPASGYVVFTPGTPYASVLSATPDPATIFPQKVIGVLDSNGYLKQAKFNGPTGEYARSVDGSYIPDSGTGVRLQSTDDSDINPTDWSWRADFFFKYNKNPISYPSFNFQLPSNKTVDLTSVKPVSEQTGEYTIVGPPGPRGEIGDPGPATTIKIGTVTTKPTGTPAEATITGESPNQTLNFAFPQGPVGPSGGPIPAGGSAGDSVVRGTGTSSEWRFTDGIQDNIFPNGSLEYNNNFRWSSVMTNTRLDAPPGFPSSMWCPAGASSFSAFTSELSPIVIGDDYIFEIWIKADKPNSNIYIEIRDQDGSHAGAWTRIEGPTNTVSAYPVGQDTVSTEWTKFKARGTLNPTTTQIRIATFYFNHSSGTEREASVGLAGLRVYRAPSVSTVSSDLLDVLPSISQKNLLNTITSSSTNSALVQRTTTGQVKVPATPSETTDATSRGYVDSSISSQVTSAVTTSVVGTPLSTESLNSITTPGLYYQTSNTNATLARNYPRVAGGSLEVRQLISGSGGPNVVQHYTDVDGLEFSRRMIGTSLKTWSNWTLVYNSISFQTGRVLVTPESGSSPGETSITFPYPFPDDIVPHVLTSPDSTVPGSHVLGTSASRVTSTGCDIFLSRTNTTTTGVFWTAVMPY